MQNTAYLEELLTHRIAVVGLGISNLPLIDFLLARGARITGRDAKSRGALGKIAHDLEQKGVHLITGKEYLENLDEEVIFRSPGLRPDLPELQRAVANGAVLTHEMELFLALTPAKVIGITGSDGKTTTTTLVGHFLTREYEKTDRHVYVGGNIGTPLLPSVAEMTDRDFAVAELSSFQLQKIAHSPHVSCITNLTENHLNWHHGMEEYIDAKQNIYRHDRSRRVVLNAENDITLNIGKENPLPVTWFSSKKQTSAEFTLRSDDRAVYARDGMILLFDGNKETPMLETKEIRLPGIHNIENYMTAIALCDGLVSPESILAVAREFTGVPHRLQPVRLLDGVQYYNSSIDSTPARTAAALSALGDTSPIVICGGRDKGGSFLPLAKSLGERAKAVILTGEALPLIRKALEEDGTALRRGIPIYEAPVFADAVKCAHDIAKFGDTVLLSPACTSFDAFQNFEERGDTFCRIVNQF